MAFRGLKVIAVLVAAAATAPTAFAADAFLCGPDTVVYVEIEDLDAAKRTNACVASYYGLKVANDVVPSNVTSSDTKLPAAVPPIASKAILKSALPLRASMIEAPAPRSGQKTPVAAVRPATHPVVAAPAEGNVPVRIINASASQNTWVPTVKARQLGD